MSDKELSIIELKEKAAELRRKIMDVTYRTRCGHPSSALSAVEIMTALYYGQIAKVDGNNPDWEDRDRVILSKGHMSVAQYIILAELGFFPKEWLDDMGKVDAHLSVHPNALTIPGVDCTTGSLGHGAPFAIGVAMGAKVSGKDYRTYVIIGDGEMQEGSCWEAIQIAVAKKLDNLVFIIDNNKIQASDFSDNIVVVSPLQEKLKAFGCETIECDGHDMVKVVDALMTRPEDKPLAIVANTLKGKGVSIMENDIAWHGKKPGPQQWEQVLSDLGM